MKNDENITKSKLQNDNKEQKIAAEDHAIINRVLIRKQ